MTKYKYGTNVIPGQSLCTNCYKKIFVLQGIEESTVESEDFIEHQIENIEAACLAIGSSPLTKLRKLNVDKRPKAVQEKLKKVTNLFKQQMETSFDVIIDDQESQETCDEYEDLIAKLKEKCASANKDEKIKIISLLPTSWSRSRIVDEFQVSERLVKYTRILVKDQGILPQLGKRKGYGIQGEVRERVLKFYECDENSRLCPGTKDCLSVIINNVKVKKQKRLILCNLNELFVQFKERNPECKIGRSKFIELRPRWCVLAGSSGTHTVCVCVYHQNVKLMIDGAKLGVTYKDLLELIVCDLKKHNCMMGECIDCPGSLVLETLFKEFH